MCHIQCTSWPTNANPSPHTIVTSLHQMQTMCNGASGPFQGNKRAQWKRGLLWQLALAKCAALRSKGKLATTAGGLPPQLALLLGCLAASFLAAHFGLCTSMGPLNGPMANSPMAPWLHRAKHTHNHGAIVRTAPRWRRLLPTPMLFHVGGLSAVLRAALASSNCQSLCWATCH